MENTFTSGVKQAEVNAGADYGLAEHTFNRSCRRGSSELLVEWPSTGQDQNGLEESVSEPVVRILDKVRSIAPSRNHDQQEQSKPRAIHFSETIHIHIVPSLEDYSSERLEQIYHTKADFAEQRAEYVATAKEMQRRHRRGEDPLQVHEVKLKTRQEHRQRRPSITTATTTRGLEHMASRCILELHRQEQRDAICTVLLAQENNIAPEEIAILYGHRARSAKTRARRYGLEDVHCADYMTCIDC